MASHSPAELDYSQDILKHKNVLAWFKRELKRAATLHAMAIAANCPVTVADSDSAVLLEWKLQYEPAIRRWLRNAEVTEGFPFPKAQVEMCVAFGYDRLDEIYANRIKEATGEWKAQDMIETLEKLTLEDDGVDGGS